MTTHHPESPTPQTATLSNGLQVIVQHTNDSVVYCGYVLRIGTRSEQANDLGMAHFIEHMTFKGTHRRTAHQINSALEHVGGELNAFTSKQETVFTATVLKDDFRLAVDVLTDIIFHSTYPQHEINKEVEVICDEIDSYLDSPAELIFDDFERIVFEGHPLGRDILGQADRLRSYTTADALHFARHLYRPENAIFYVYGNADFKQTSALLEKTFSKYPTEPYPTQAYTPLAMPAPKTFLGGGSPHTIYKHTHQAHIVVGTARLTSLQENIYPLLLLNNIIGGPCMNSLLGIALRERTGLVYTVESALSRYVDYCVWNVYLGCDPADVGRCLKIVRREMNKLCQRPLSPSRLKAAKRQFIGQYNIGCDQRENYAINMGKEFAFFGSHRSKSHVAGCIESISAEELQQCAQQIFNPNVLTTLIYQ